MNEKTIHKCKGLNNSTVAFDAKNIKECPYCKTTFVTDGIVKENES